MMRQSEEGEMMMIELSIVPREKKIDIYKERYHLKH